MVLVLPVASKLKHLKNHTEQSLDEEHLKEFLETEYEENESKWCNIQAVKEWNHLVDIDNKLKAEASVILQTFF